MEFDPNWGLFVANVALVGVTIYYAIQTQRLVNVPFRPSLMSIFLFNPLPNNEFALKLKIENVGFGVATDVKMEYDIIRDKSKIDVVVTTIWEKLSKRTTKKTKKIIRVQLPLYPLDKSNPTLPHKNSESPFLDIEGLPSTQKEYYSQHKVKLKGMLKCKDVFGKEHKFKRNLDVGAELPF